MKILLDTHIMLWTMTDDEQLPQKARELIENEDNEIFFSIISLWEIQIKHILHPEQMENSKVIARYCHESDFELINLSERAIEILSDLKRPDSAPRHKDPFDKMLICQAVAEEMTFLTHDSLLPDYGVANIMLV